MTAPITARLASMRTHVTALVNPPPAASEANVPQVPRGLWCTVNARCRAAKASADLSASPTANPYGPARSAGVRRRTLVAVVVAYVFSPIDLIPDFVPVLGYFDDLLLVPAGIYVALRLIPDDVLSEARLKADAWIEARRDKPKSYAAAALVVAIWLAAAWGVALLFV